MRLRHPPISPRFSRSPPAQEAKNTQPAMSAATPVLSRFEKVAISILASFLAKPNAPRHELRRCIATPTLPAGVLDKKTAGAA
jgi:hypothetical protein